jgi:nucleoporin SEH1
MDQHGKWQAREELYGHEGVVHDVAWAPNVGR